MNNFLARTLSTFILIPLSFFFIFQGSYLLIFFLTICFFLASFEWSKIVNLFSLKFFGFIFLFFSFYFFYEISKEYWKVLYIIIVCISTDIGGYVFGKIFKGPKLTKISPNKTFAGMVGSYFLSIFSLILFVTYFNQIQITFANFLILTIFMSTISQIGDLIISYFKRKSNIKNTGNLIPGHGGLLDRIDGMIFTIPVFYLFNLFII